MSDPQIFQLAEVLWQYHWLNQTFTHAECMIVLGSDDLRVAELAADLYHQGYGEYMVLTGKANRYSSHFLPLSEAEKFAEVIREKEVPSAKILLENFAANTGENVLFTQKLLEGKKLSPKNFLIITKPYMERRVFATFHKVWPDQQFTITSPLLSLDQYIDSQHSLERLVRAMIGYVRRIEDYPALGFQIPQEVPREVKQASEKLEALGFQAV